MSMRRLAFPKTQLQAQELINRRQDQFLGMDLDDPASNLSQGYAQDLVNATAFNKYIEGRTGSRLIKDLDLPNNNKQYLIDKIGPNAYFRYFNPALVLNPGTIADISVGDYLVLQGNGHPEHYQVTQIVPTPPSGDPYCVCTISEDNRNTTTSATETTRKRVWGTTFNEMSQQIIVHIGTKLYFIDQFFANNYQEIVFCGASADQIVESRSIMRSDLSDVIVFNGNGIYRINFFSDAYGTHARYFKINSALPTSLIETYQQIAIQTKSRNYIYTMSRILGQNTIAGDRTTGLIVQESASTAVDPKINQDTSMLYGAKSVSDSDFAYGMITSGPVHGIISDWKAITNGGFAISINGLPSQTISLNFAAVTNMTDICSVIQNALQPFFPGSECYFQTNPSTGDMQIIVTSGQIAGGVIVQPTAPLSGYTNILGTGTGGNGYLPLDAKTSAVLNNAARAGQSFFVEGEQAPVGSKHWTHLSIYSSKDPNAAAGNLSDMMIWNNDVPLIKPMSVQLLEPVTTPTAIYIFDATASPMVFERADEGCWVTGSATSELYELGYLCDSSGNRVYDPTSPYIQVIYQNTAMALSTPSIIAIGANSLDTVTQTGTALNCTSGRFSSDMVGGQVFLENGNILIVTSYQSVYAIQVQESGTISTAIAAAWNYSFQKYNLTIYNSGSHMHPTMLAIPGYGSSNHFSTSMVGKYVFINNNDLTTPIAMNNFSQYYPAKITAIDPHSLNLTLSLPSSMLVNSKNMFISNVPPRAYNDVIPDSTLNSRLNQNTFLLQTRFFLPLPSSPIGELANNFMVVSPLNSRQIMYSQMPTDGHYITGYYSANDQFSDSVRDNVLNLKSINGRLVAQCQHSHWGLTLSQYGEIDMLTGQTIFTLPIFSIIDYKGYVPGGTRDIDLGSSLVFCNDGSMHLFDGSSFDATNQAYGACWKALRQFYQRVITSYDRVAGLQIFGTSVVTTDTANAINWQTGECFALSVSSMQGTGWRRYSGSDMVFPEPNTEGMIIPDQYGNLLSLMLDEKTGRWWQISTYNGPINSGLVATYKDKWGASIQAAYHSPEHTGTLESYQIEHLESHAYTRPIDPVAGYMENFSISAEIYADGQSFFNAITQDIPITGDTTFDRQTLGNRISVRYIFSESGFQMVSSDHFYDSRDRSNTTAPDQGPNQEQVYQNNYSQGNVWLTRGLNQLMNRQNGIPATGNFTPTDGPDGVSNSAMKFSATDPGLTLPVAGTYDSDFTIQFGFRFQAP